MSAVVSEGRHAALAVPSRRRLLEILRRGDGPMDASTLAEAIGLHLTTTRFHLDVLAQAGLVHRCVERDGRPGRPRQLYRAVDEQADDETGAAQRYRELAGVLAGALGITRRRAEDAGRRWAAAQVPVQNLSWEDGTQRVVSVFERLGFASRVVDDRDGRHVELTTCPFRDLARAYPHVICTVHAGLLQGTLSRSSVPDAERAEIRPFVAAELCIADLPAAQHP